MDLKVVLGDSSIPKAKCASLEIDSGAAMMTGEPGEEDLIAGDPNFPLDVIDSVREEIVGKRGISPFENHRFLGGTRFQGASV